MTTKESLNAIGESTPVRLGLVFVLLGMIITATVWATTVTYQLDAIVKALDSKRDKSPEQDWTRNQMDRAARDAGWEIDIYDPRYDSRLMQPKN